MAVVCRDHDQRVGVGARCQSSAAPMALSKAIVSPIAGTGSRRGRACRSTPLDLKEEAVAALAAQQRDRLGGHVGEAGLGGRTLIGLASDGRAVAAVGLLECRRRAIPGPGFIDQVVCSPVNGKASIRRWPPAPA
jgi:hypothetical protein